MQGVSVTSKGQVTLPVQIRKHLGIRPGDRLLFVLEGSGARVFVLHRRPLSELFGSLKVEESGLDKHQWRQQVAEYLACRHRGL
ncbi:MAG: AbrB/MazE/SpoVT family DNA-binding domain-containing protein [Thermoanaerobaculum sp.]